jgi:hypothetical protein
MTNEDVILFSPSHVVQGFARNNGKGFCNVIARSVVTKHPLKGTKNAEIRQEGKIDNLLKLLYF